MLTRCSFSCLSVLMRFAWYICWSVTQNFLEFIDMKIQLFMTKRYHFYVSERLSDFLHVHLNHLLADEVKMASSNHWKENMPFPHSVESGGKFLRCKKICWSVNVKPFRNGFNAVSVIWLRALILSVFSPANLQLKVCQHFTLLILLADNVKFCHSGWESGVVFRQSWKWR